MITMFVAILSSVVTTAATYYLLHRANPTATQVVLDSTVTQAQADAKAVEADVVAKL